MQTTDLNLAALLIAKGQQLVNAWPEDNGKYIFEFMDDEDVVNLNQEYYLGRAMINPYEYVIAQKSLKNIIRNYKPANLNYVKRTIISKSIQQ